MFIPKGPEVKFVVKSLYVNDLLIAGNGIELPNKVKPVSSSNVEMVYISKVAYALEIKFSRE